MNRLLTRRFLVAAIVVLICAFIFKVSFFQDNKENYLFPAIVATAILLMSLTSLFRETFELCLDDFKSFRFLLLLPAIIAMFVAVMFLEHLGMYATCAILLFLMSVFYAPGGTVVHRLIGGLILSAGFTAFMYVLFNLMLGVQTPRGLLL